MNNDLASTISLNQLFRVESISADTQAVNAKLADTLATLDPPTDLVSLRDAYTRGLLGLPASPKSPHARQLSIPGPGGPLDLRILVPDVVRGLYLHFHGGGWMVGSNDTWDEQLEMFGREAGVASVSVNYRLAPEHPFPAAVDDCVATALWLSDNAEREFKTKRLIIGGESAGAHLAALTLLQLRDLRGAAPFVGANLLFGCYDLSLTPSVRLARKTPFVDRLIMEQFVTAFANGTSLRDAAISPLYANLNDMPPALFTVGSADPLCDDSLFMYERWRAAGCESRLAIFPGGVHGFNSLGGELAFSANRGMAAFLSECCSGDI